MSSQRKTVICGVTTYPPSMIITYLFNKVFTDAKFHFGETIVEANTDYVFIHEPPTIEEVNEMKTKNSTATLIAVSQDQTDVQHLKGLPNVLWITGENMIEEVFKTFASSDLSPVTASKIKRAQPSDANFRTVMDMLLSGLADDEDDVQKNLTTIFKQFDELFSLKTDEIDTIARYNEIRENQFINDNVEHATMSVDYDSEETYNVVICESNVNL